MSPHTLVAVSHRVSHHASKRSVQRRRPRARHSFSHACAFSDGGSHAPLAAPLLCPVPLLPGHMHPALSPPEQAQTLPPCLSMPNLSSAPGVRASFSPTGPAALYKTSSSRLRLLLARGSATCSSHEWVKKPQRCCFSSGVLRACQLPLDAHREWRGRRSHQARVRRRPLAAGRGQLAIQQRSQAASHSAL